MDEPFDEGERFMGDNVFFVGVTTVCNGIGTSSCVGSTLLGTGDFRWPNVLICEVSVLSFLWERLERCTGEVQGMQSEVILVSLELKLE